MDMHLQQMDKHKMSQNRTGPTCNMNALHMGFQLFMLCLSPQNFRIGKLVQAASKGSDFIRLWALCLCDKRDDGEWQSIVVK